MVGIKNKTKTYIEACYFALKSGSGELERIRKLISGESTFIWHIRACILEWPLHEMIDWNSRNFLLLKSPTGFVPADRPTGRLVSRAD